MTEDPKENFSILVVDDEKEMVEIISFMVESKGYKVLTADCPKDALKVLESQEIDIVLSDVKMPVDTGFDLIDKINERFPNPPIVFFVTGSLEVSLDIVYEKGAHAVFYKPVEYDALLASIELHLHHRHPNQRLPRINIEKIDLDFQLLYDGDSVDFEIKPLNLGRGGVFIAVGEDPLPAKGQEFDFELDYNYKDISYKCQGKGEVAWVRSDPGIGQNRGFGYKFLNFDEASKFNLWTLVNGLTTQSIIPSN